MSWSRREENLKLKLLQNVCSAQVAAQREREVTERTSRTAVL